MGNKFNKTEHSLIWSNVANSIDLRFITVAPRQLHLSKRLKELSKRIQMEEKNLLINEFQFVDYYLSNLVL